MAGNGGGSPVECILKVSKHELERAKAPEMSPPIERATFSTKLRTDRQERMNHQELHPTLEKYTVQHSYSRTLCDSDHANHKYLQTTQLPYDLDHGYGTEIQKEKENEFMSLLLQCLADRDLIGQSEFVCWRNLLTVLCSTPYDIGGLFDNGMIVVVQKIKGVFYMFEFPTQESLVRQANLDRRQKQMIYWGMKFESYMTGTSKQPLNLNQEFCSVVESKIGTHSITFRGEIDCCRANGSYVELKTNKEFEHVGHKNSFRKYKLIKWWLQSSLLGVPEIVCGFRDENGMVGRLKQYKVKDLPGMMQQCKPSACLAFLDTFLDFVKANVKSEYIPHVFKRQAKSASFEMTLDMEGKYKFIPHWFVAEK